MKNIIEEYIPFEHSNLDYINGSLNLARQQKLSGKPEGLMASTLIYTNLVEYLATNLLENLHHMVFLFSYHNFNGVFFIKSKEKIKSKIPQTLGQLRKVLSNYEFPDSTDFILLLQKFAETRNIIFHRLLTVSDKEIKDGTVDKQFSDLHSMAEEVLDKYNAIVRGITNVWQQSKTPTKEQLQEQVNNLTQQIDLLNTQITENQNKK